VFILNDHQAFYGHGWEGGPQIQRPYFDRLASQGILFNRAYTACPLCGPARRTMLTGLYPHNHGETKNKSDHPFDREVYLPKLTDAGYRNIYYGKWHAGPGSAHDFGCEEAFSYYGYNNPYTKPEYHDYLRRKGLPEPQIRLEHVFVPPQRMPKDSDTRLYSQNRPNCNEHASGIMTTPKETHEAFFLASLACDKLAELAATEDDRPFALRVDFWGPHQPYFPTEEYLNLYPPEQIPEYPSFRDDLTTKPELYKSERNFGISREGKLIQPNPLPWSAWQQILSRCYAQITMMDEAAGLILDQLDRLGLSDNPLVVWTTDHGDAVACHGGHFDKSSYMPEELIRIPMTLRYPGVVPAGQVSEKLVSNIDLAPTFLDAAGLAFARPVDGSSLLPLAANPDIPWRTEVVSETHGHGEDALGRALVSERYKYIFNENDMDELYDLQSDRYEMNNLIDSAEHRERLANMRGKLRAWQAATGDNSYTV
jgi:arylsulfatase A-like enzyme